MGELARIAGRQADLLQQLFGQPGRVTAARRDWFGNDITHPPSRVQRCKRVLKNHLNVGAHCIDFVFVCFAGQISATNFNGPFGRGQQTHQHLADGGFARSAFADQRIDGLFLDIETDVRYRRQQRARAAFDQTVQPRLGHIKNAGEVADTDKGHQATSARSIG